MGSGVFSSTTYRSYSTSKGLSVDVNTNKLASNYTADDLFKQRGLNKALNPKGVVRECCDSDEHPNTIPVILALDVSGSMGDAAAEVAKSLGAVMSDLYKSVTDVEFLIMGIDDLEGGGVPIQASQFESDIRIAEQLDQLYLEYWGCGNGYESYTAAWVFGAKQTKLDCWKRGKKGIIITIGDENITRVLFADDLKQYMGLTFEKDISPSEAYDMVKDKYDVYHIHVTHNDYSSYYSSSPKTFAEVIGEDHVKAVATEDVPQAITDIVIGCANGNSVDTSFFAKTPEWGDAIKTLVEIDW